MVPGALLWFLSGAYVCALAGPGGGAECLTPVSGRTFKKETCPGTLLLVKNQDTGLTKREAGAGVSRWSTARCRLMELLVYHVRRKAPAFRRGELSTT